MLAHLPPLTDAQQAMVEANLGLVGFVLDRRHTPHDEWDDCFQDGIIGLMRATQLFDPDRGFQFSTYALYWIRQGVGRGRARLLGVNYRRELDDFVPALSLDHPLSDGEGYGDVFGSLADVALCDDQAPDDQATDAAYIAELTALLDSWPLDRIDRAIADDLLVLTDTAWIRRDRAIAARFGYEREIIRQRRMRLQARLRTWAGRAAA